MSGTYEDMMTPEQARMMYAALLDKLPLDSPAAQSISVGAGLPVQQLSAPPPETQPAGTGPQAPVVTDGIASQLPVPPIPPTEAPSAAPTEAPPDQTDPLGRLRSLIGGGERPSPEDRGRESLMNFFFSMAASRNPSFFGQLGEAGQALAQADRAARTEARQERQLDVEAAYRAAQEARQLREQLAQEDPNSIQGRFMQARINNLEAQSRYYLQRGSGESSRERLGTGYEVEDPTSGRQGVAYMGANGQPVVRWLPENLRRAQTPQQQAADQQRRAQNYLAAERAARDNLSRDMRWPALSEEERQRRLNTETTRILGQIERVQSQGRPGAAQQPPAQTEGTAPPRTGTGVARYDAFGRPITQ